MPNLDFRPLAFFISYPELLDNCLVKFIDDFNDDFAYDADSNLWVLRRSLSKKKLEKVFFEYLSLEAQRLLFLVDRRWDCLNKLFFICDDGVESGADYYLQESDIAIDLELLKNVWNKIFASWHAAGHDNNVVFCKHNEVVDKQWLSEVLEKKVFGKRRTVDLTSTIKSGMKTMLGRTFSKHESLCKLVSAECEQWLRSQISQRVSNGMVRDAIENSLIKKERKTT